ncbi:MAG TPA: hypothetical protein ENF83_04020 [Candidatus Korarchaeota archaeon]|nr:MAG: hypothetical protein DRO01_03945 [Candidatus Korarchaeota archaeon]HDI86552.1 hypothetical protein [Candidatus Korarchaeota archaeon]
MRRLSLEEAGVFHGHLGPYLTLGYLAGELAVSQLDPQSEFDLTVRVELPLRRPETCFLDGIQCSSRCTLGKLNIKVAESASGEGISATFLNVKSGEVLEVAVREEVLERLRSMEGSLSLSEAVDWVLSQPVDLLFRVRRSRGPIRR